MSRLSALSFAAGVALIVYFVVFSYTALRPVEVFWYRPLAGAWVFAASGGPQSDLAMDWFGRLLWAVSAGAVTGGLLYLVLRKVGREPEEGSFAPWALTLNVLVFLVLTSATFAWTLGRRDLPPTPSLPFEQTGASWEVP